MKRILLFIVCMCMVVLSGCGGKTNNEDNIVTSKEVTDSNVTEDYLNNLQENYDPAEIVTEETKELFPIPSTAMGGEYITDLEGNKVKAIEYTGERMTYEMSTYILQTRENGPENFIGVFFILVDGYLQPFYFGDSEEEVLYASINEASSEELSKYTFSFDPIYAPYDDTAYVTFILSYVPDYLFDTNNVMLYTYDIAVSCKLSSATEECAVEYEKAESTLEINTDFDAGGAQTAGQKWVTKKLTSVNQLRINTFFDTDEQLFMTTVDSVDAGETEDVRVFAVVDGKLANLFGGNYYVDFRQEPGVAYEVPLDMDYFSKNENHQVYFIKLNRAELESKVNAEVYIGTEMAFCVTVR